MTSSSVHWSIVKPRMAILVDCPSQVFVGLARVVKMDLEWKRVKRTLKNDLTRFPVWNDCELIDLYTG